jgi:hypothetical protein
MNIDLNSFMSQRNPNLYNQIGIDRNSDTDLINERLN